MPGLPFGPDMPLYLTLAKENADALSSGVPDAASLPAGGGASATKAIIGQAKEGEEKAQIDETGGGASQSSCMWPW